MRATATLQPAIWARRSTATSSGMRERRMNSSSRSTRSSPSSTTRTGGIIPDSQKMSDATGLKPPGAVPPRSWWCRLLPTHAKTRSSQNTGASMVRSDWWVAPIQGSLDMNMHPGSMPGRGWRFSRIHFTAGLVAATRYCSQGPKKT